MVVPGSLGKLVYRYYQFAWVGLDWLYPPSCGGCNSSGFRWCPDCDANTQSITGSICYSCGTTLKSAGTCNQCQESPPPYRASRSWAVFNGPIQNALHRLKYQGDIALGEILARPMVVMLKTFDWNIDLITAVPLGVARQKERGYNQAALLALPLALGSGKTYHSKALIKIRETPTQVGLNRIQRRMNVVGAFLANESAVSGKSVLVVDDVTTSGATLEACAFALIEAGARRVYGFTLARVR